MCTSTLVYYEQTVRLKRRVCTGTPVYYEQTVRLRRRVCTVTPVYYEQTVRVRWKGTERAALRSGSNRRCAPTPTHHRRGLTIMASRHVHIAHAVVVVLAALVTAAAASTVDAADVSPANAVAPVVDACDACAASGFALHDALSYEEAHQRAALGADVHLANILDPTAAATDAIARACGPRGHWLRFQYKVLGGGAGEEAVPAWLTLNGRVCPIRVHSLNNVPSQVHTPHIPEVSSSLRGEFRRFWAVLFNFGRF